jgi:hypothetical protein
VPASASGSNHSPNSSSTTLAPAPKPTRSDSNDGLKSFKVSLDDPAWKVLPAALKKYKINNDDWQNYAMFICYGSTGERRIAVRLALRRLMNVNRTVFELR